MRGIGAYDALILQIKKEPSDGSENTTNGRIFDFFTDKTLEIRFDMLLLNPGDCNGLNCIDRDILTLEKPLQIADIGFDRACRNLLISQQLHKRTQRNELRI